MLIPSTIAPITAPATAGQADTEYRDLLTAMRLLSGRDCKRDAAQAQVILVGLTESRRTDLAADAQEIMRAGLARGWFDDVVPRFLDLERLAEKSVGHYRSNPQRRNTTALFLGLAVLFVGGIAAFAVSSGTLDEGPPWIMLAVVAGLLVVGALAFVARSR